MGVQVPPGIVFYFLFLGISAHTISAVHGAAPRCIADIAQLGERQTEDLKVPGSIPGVGIFYFYLPIAGFKVGWPSAECVPWHLGRVVKAID